MKPVVIIGGGFAGIISLKICLENGLDAYVYERLDNFGGLWRFRETVDEDGIPSVMKNTIIDTSKEVGAISDFPPPAECPNYMHNTMMIEYLTSYMNENNLRSRIKFRHEIIKVEKATDYEKTGDWRVYIKNKANDEQFAVDAQAVFVCTGHHAWPNYPHFVGEEEFKGKIIHSHSIKSGTDFEGQKVVVVGVGNSAMDVASELSFVAKQVYLSTRKGVWISPRCGPNGYPLDFLFTRVSQYFHDYFTESWRKRTESYLSSIFDHQLYGLKPRHRCDQQHPSVSDIVPARILAGAIKVKGDISRLTSKGVIFKDDGGNEIEVDAIALCTGYNIRIPFLPENDSSLPGAPKKNNVELFERIFPVQLPHPTLAFIGMCQPIGPLFPLMELQARWVCRLLEDHKKPVKALKGFKAWPTSVQERAKEVAEYKAKVTDYFVDSQRHTIEVEYVKYMETLSKRVGCNPNLFRTAITDFPLFKALMFGPFVSYQFRLRGPHKWAKARETILDVENRVKKGFGSGRGQEVSRKRSKRSIFRYTLGLAAIVATVSYIYKYTPFQFYIQQ